MQMSQNDIAVRDGNPRSILSWMISKIDEASGSSCSLSYRQASLHPSLHLSRGPHPMRAAGPQVGTMHQDPPPSLYRSAGTHPALPAATARPCWCPATRSAGNDPPTAHAKVARWRHLLPRALLAAAPPPRTHCRVGGRNRARLLARTTIWGARACSIGEPQQSGEHARAALVNHNNLGSKRVQHWWFTAIWGARACSTGEPQQTSSGQAQAVVCATVRRARMCSNILTFIAASCPVLSTHLGSPCQAAPADCHAPMTLWRLASQK